MSKLLIQQRVSNVQSTEMKERTPVKPVTTALCGITYYDKSNKNAFVAFELTDVKGIR